MTRPSGRFAALVTVVLAAGVCVWPEPVGRIASAQQPPAKAKLPDPALEGSTVVAVLDANGGKVPASGQELWQALSRLGKFAQLPVVFSAVRLDSGIGNPRVVITPMVTGLSDASATAPSLNGRLYLAANMEKDPKGGDPRVTSVEFISWNALRRKFDFGVIEDVGTGEPRMQVLDGGKCFSCHKNKGPILGAAPWTNSANHTGLRALTAGRFKLSLPGEPVGAGQRDRIDGMALVAPQAQAVDDVVRLGAMLRLQRDTFRLMNRYDGGRKGFVAMLVAVTQSGELDPNDKPAKVAVDRWGFEQSYLRFANEWVSLAKTTSTGILIDFAPIPKPLYEWEKGIRQKVVPTPPPGGFRTAREAQNFQAKVDLIKFENQQAEAKRLDRLRQLALYDEARASGRHGMPTEAQPSNPRAFVPVPPKAPQRPSGLVNPLMLANTIGLTEGDRKFMADALAAASKRITKQKVTPAALAKEVFEGPEFADVLKGEPLPDRDDFKDRFVAGLNTLLTTRYKLKDGFAPERSEYARTPRRDPKAVEQAEAAIVPTSACLRCHEVRDGGKARVFDPIPPLAFDPLDEKTRALWLQAATAKRKQEVLSRMLERLVKDADMPPEDSPEHEHFRVKQAAAFDGVKKLLEAEIAALK
jgi:hypothetical protein